jgi:hypothetical protein
VVVRAVVSKRGVDDGNQKGGDFLQPAQESQKQYNPEKIKTQEIFSINFFCRKYKNSFLTLSEIFYMT